MPATRFPLNRDVLHAMYVEQEMSTSAIAEHFGCSVPLVKQRLREFDIPRRSASEAARLRKPPSEESNRKRSATAKKKGLRPPPPKRHGELSEAHLRALRENAIVARAAITAESLKKQSESMRGKPAWNKGRAWTEEDHANHEYRKDPEYRRRMSEANKRARPRNQELSTLEERLRGWEWRATRRRVYERDNWTCQDCGVHCQNKIQSRTKATVRIQCHHVVARRDGGSDDLDNLVTLCMSCHMKREWRERRRP